MYLHSLLRLHIVLYKYKNSAEHAGKKTNKMN